MIKKMSLGGLAGLMMMALSVPAFAADKGKEVTITGEGKCGKCALHKSEKCHNVIETTGKDGKKVTYWLDQNETSKNFHDNICKEAKQVTATGTVHKSEDGRKVLTASKIELANK